MLRRGPALILAMFAASPATAGDLLTPSQPIGWNGFYVGGSLGGGWDGGDIGNAFSTICNPGVSGCTGDAASNALGAALPRRFNTDPSGFIGGGQIGYNVRRGGFVGGIVTDFLAADISGSQRKADTQPIVGFPVSITASGFGSQQLDFLGTLRGRVGWAAFDQLLIYGTGGLAYGHTELNATFSERINGSCIGCGPFPTIMASSDDWRAGWTVGAGAEWMFAPRWSLRGQYLYYDLGDVSVRQRLLQTVVPDLPFYWADIKSTAHFNGSVATIGLNYQF
jgi:outer membrane immunogenic protein